MKCIVARLLVIGIIPLTFIQALKGHDEAYPNMFIVIEELLFKILKLVCYC